MFPIVLHPHSLKSVVFTHTQESISLCTGGGGGTITIVMVNFLISNVVQHAYEAVLGPFFRRNYPRT